MIEGHFRLSRDCAVIASLASSRKCGTFLVLPPWHRRQSLARQGCGNDAGPQVSKLGLVLVLFWGLRQKSKSGNRCRAWQVCCEISQDTTSAKELHERVVTMRMSAKMST